MLDIKNDPRMAGDVKRYHTWPVLQAQSVAEHSWNVARILVYIHPIVTKELLQEALFHDTGELACGDLPFPVKSKNKDLKNIMDELEESSRSEMEKTGQLPKTHFIHDYERSILKIADMLEMWEKGRQECNLGNKFAELIVLRTEEWLDETVAALGNGSLKKNVLSYMSSRKIKWPYGGDSVVRYTSEEPASALTQPLAKFRRLPPGGQANLFDFDPELDIP